MHRVSSNPYNKILVCKEDESTCQKFPGRNKLFTELPAKSKRSTLPHPSSSLLLLKPDLSRLAHTTNPSGIDKSPRSAPGKQAQIQLNTGKQAGKILYRSSRPKTTKLNRDK
jgi:hypothetical protein